MNHLTPVDAEPEKLTFTDTLSNVLNKLANFHPNSCLQVTYNSTLFFVHVNEGQLIYATNSLAPFERLERHLRRLSNQSPQLANQIIKQPRQRFKNDLQSYTQLPSDYQGIIWLLEQGHLTSLEAVTLIRRITREVFESFLCLPDYCQYKFVPKLEQIPKLCRFDLKSYIEQCQKRLAAWQVFADKISSPYQRPYLVTMKAKAIGGLTAQQNETISQLLKGLNFRQIAAVIDRDELVVAKILYPSMIDNTIVLRDPKSPFDRLPQLPKKEVLNLTTRISEPDWRGENSGFQINSHSKQTVQALETKWKIAYVDDNQSAHRIFTNYLQPNLFSTRSIVDEMNAFTELIEFEPNLILLNVNMPNLSGYELCTLLRNYGNFQTVPIIMVGEALELTNFNKLKRAGATDSLSKPFSHQELLNMIWKYLQ
ncbi:MAG: response regulator [Pleurocapsa sp.]